MEAIERRHFTVIGCGSLGTVMGRILARLGAHRFHLIDGEAVELRHLNREVFSHDQLGDNKAAALASQLQRIHPKVRSVTTAKRFDVGHLQRGKEDVIVCTTSDLTVPGQVLEAVRGWDESERPAVLVARHTRLVGGYWMADLRTDPSADLPPDLPWMIATGSQESDARCRIATTAHAVAGLTSQAVVEHINGRRVKPVVTLDLGELLRVE